MIKRLLVANRGEVAVRVMATAAVLGIETVAVYPADDAACGHVTRADTAVELPGTGVAAYLDVDAVIAAAAGAGCDTLHPGYGFLSERPELAARCAAAGLRFAGPDAEALALFGDKAATRARARELGVPVLAGTGIDPPIAQVRGLLHDYGAVMVKAVAGGGGRGLRPVTREEDLAEAMRRCASEAASAFGDGRVYAERLLTGARHVEVQLLGDGTGAVAVLGDRDCSLQRRRQKLIEIAPAMLGDAVRARLAEAATALAASVRYRGLATAEFLVRGEEIAFLEVNPRLQVEHTVTEQVTGLDLVELGLRVADGATLEGLDLDARPRGVAVQARVNAEALQPDGTFLPGDGTLTRFQPPAGRGVRVDTAAYQGYPVSTHYDSLLAKVITGGSTLAEAARRAVLALAEFGIAGVPTNAALLQVLLRLPGLGTLEAGYLDAHAAELAAAAGAGAPAAEAADAEPDGSAVVRAPLTGTVVSVAAEPGQLVAAGEELLVIEAMKMEHEVRAQAAGRVREVPAAVGDTVPAGAVLVVLDGAGADGSGPALAAEVPLDHIRPDLAESRERHRTGLDEGRPGVTERRHATGRRTARENIADLVDEGSFTEYGALVIAAQRRRRALDDLIARTPADGLVLGTARVGGRPVAVMSYDYTVLAGTQGHMNHRKTDRLLDLARRERLPLVMFAEGGGGRPGDTDTTSVGGLDVPTFRLTAELSGQVPLVAVVSGYCFAGNAALAGACDVIIATPEASLGMGGPAMIEGGGLGIVAPGDVGPMSVQVPNGVVDVLVPDDAAAVAAARRYLSYFSGFCPGEADHGDQRRLRHLIPENRVRAYDVRPVIEALCDTGSVLELRPEFGVGILTALVRIGGFPVGLLANNPLHLGGAIDGDAADKATAFLRLCEAHRLPVLSLVDTPGFMVGPEAERTAVVRRFGAMFVAGARLTVPICAVVLRKAYGLGAMAMTAGDLRRPAITVAWPTGEFGGMGLEGAVRLGYRRELDAISDPGDRQARYEQLVADQYTRGKALSTAMAFEIDDVIDPADTRGVITDVLGRALPVSGG
ncbi:MAG TPA: carboxyl transferase domain-containing protein [Streptosporangiaceae bacterium]|nr:carboxyl transferase domain-containing protein [Streptosporangiaceae bacterium]